MSSPLPLRGRLAVLTGAGSGIGRAVAYELARRGMRLALADVDAAGLAETAAAVQATGAEVSTHRLDVSDRDAVMDLPDAVREAHGAPAAVVGNIAGVALGGTFETTTEADFDWLMGVNFEGVVRMTRAFLPMLHESSAARIVNVSSLFGLISTPGQTAYTASKYAVRGFSESLRHELAGTRIGVTTVHPGGVATSIAANARAPKDAAAEEVERGKKAFAALLKLPPEKAAEAIVSGIETGRARIVIGNDAKIAALIERILPVNHWAVLKRLGGRG